MEKNRKKLLVEIVIILLVFSIGAVFINRFFKPAIVFVILFMITLPLEKFLSKYFKSSGLRALIAMIIINVIVLFLVVTVGGFLYGKIMVLMKSGAVNSLNNVKILLINLEKNIKYEHIATELYSKLTNLSGIILTKGFSVTSSGVSTYFFANIMLFFGIKDKDVIYGYIEKVLGMRLSSFLRVKFTELRGYLKVQGILVVISAVQMIIGFAFLGVEDAVSYGVVCGVLDILPFVGILIVFIPLILINIYYKKYLLSLGLLILYVYIVISREILEVKFSSKSLEIHPFVLFVSLYVGYEIQGFTGAVMMCLCSITLKELINTGDFTSFHKKKECK